MVKVVLGVLLFLFGIFAGFYVGLWWAFIGGIVQIIDAAQMTPVPGLDIALGVVRIMAAGFLGYLSAMVCILPSLALMAAGAKEL